MRQFESSRQSIAHDTRNVFAISLSTEEERRVCVGRVSPYNPDNLNLRELTRRIRRCARGTRETPFNYVTRMSREEITSTKVIPPKN